MAMETAAAESDLVRALKQLIELRNPKQQGGRAAAIAESVTLFGKKLCVAKSGDHDSAAAAASSQNVSSTTVVHLKELYEQHLKRKARDALTTLPLLNGSQGKDDVSIKRRRIGLDQFCVSGSQPAPTSLQAGPMMLDGPSFQQIEKTVASENDVDPRNGNEISEGAPLTMFYNGLVYVYDDIPMDKAQAIMILAAGSVDACSSRTVSSERAPAAASKGAKSGPAKRDFTLADLPQARKASLQRFLEKRKDRLVVKVEKKSRTGFPGTPPQSPPSRKQQQQQQIGSIQSVETQ